MTEIAFCPVCGSGGTPCFEQRDFNCGLDGLFGQRFCPACRLYFLSPRVPEDRIHHYYPDVYEDYQTDSHPPLVRWLAWKLGLAQRKRYIVEKFVREGRLLDVGCGAGFFLKTMAGAEWQCYAMDMESHDKHDFPGEFHRGCFDHEAPPLSGLDVVTLWHVFEHLYHPQRALENAAAVLRPGGWLFLAMPELRNVERLIFGRYWVGWDPPRHVATYSCSAIRTLLGRSGFTLIDIVPDVCSGELFLRNIDFFLRSRGRNSTLFRSLILRVALAPLTFMLNLAGLAPAKVYVARK